MKSLDIFGAEIQYFRLDPKYWEEIVKRFVDSGLKCVTSYVPWEVHCVSLPDKKHPAGKMDFEGKTDPRKNVIKFLELLEKYNLLLNFRSGPFCCNEMPHGGYPGWLVLGDPAMMVWDWQNRTTQGYWIGRREGSQPSYLHPDYLSLCEAWFDEVDKIAAKHLASKGGCISMINLDNEISYICRDSLLDSDYNPVNVRRGGFYHQFLKEKYVKVSSLPYQKNYQTFEEITPPRNVPQDISDDFAYYADWMEFKTWCMCRYIGILRKMHQDNGIKDVIFMTNFNPHLPEGVPTRMPSFENAVGKGGVVGYDFYRGTFMSYSGYHSMARVLKLMNACLQYTYSAEFMSGTWNKDLTNRSRVSEDHMRFMARCALAHGCKAISWFMFHDRDCWGDAPVSSHGHMRPNLNVLKETIEICNKIKTWDDLKPLNDVAIIYDLYQHIHTAIGDPMPCADNNLYTGKPFVKGAPAGEASREYIGLFRLIEQAGAQSAAVDTVYDASHLKNYKLVFLPGSPIISSKTFKAISSYVKAGGNLILTGTIPKINENGKKVNFFGINPANNKKRLLEKRIGKGRILWSSSYIAQEEPEKEEIEIVNKIKLLTKQFAGKPYVSVQPDVLPVSWIDWAPEGGTKNYLEPRNLASAILQKSQQETILFVLNHYPEAVPLKVEFAKIKVRELEEVVSGKKITVENNTVLLDIDRKTCEIYRVY
jgi:beta-galactosidase